MTTDDLEAWALWMRAQSWSETTIKNRRRMLQRLAERTGRAPVELTTGEVLMLLGAPGLASGTRRTYYVALRSWFDWLLITGRREDDPMATVKKPRQGRVEIKPLHDDHVRRLLDSGIYARTKTMVLLAAYQGLRASEIAKVRGSDLDRVSQTIRVAGKGGVVVDLPLHPLVAAEAERYTSSWWFPARRGPDGIERPGPIAGASVTTVVAGAMKRAGVPGTCHSLRHWYATSLLRAGVDIRVIQELMRHATLATTERYLHVDDSARRAGILRLQSLHNDPDADVELPPHPGPARDPGEKPWSGEAERGTRCPPECPGHALIDDVETHVEVEVFDGPGHVAPLVRLEQNGEAIYMPLTQVDKLSKLAGNWREYGTSVDRG
jgi:integrase/recombinase XerD